MNENYILQVYFTSAIRGYAIDVEIGCAQQSIHFECTELKG